jgi:glycosyltransferase involved in cell wall biosynthesis
VVVVSHAAVLGANRSLARLAGRFEVTYVVPARWRDELRPRPYDADGPGDLPGELVTVRTLGLGRPQRHRALVRAGALLRARRAAFVLIEEEPFSLAARQWSAAARREGIPYAVQVAENLRRAMPAPARVSCRRVLRGAAFVLARSPAALARAREWGYAGDSAIVPHGVPAVAASPAEHPSGVVGFVGRLVDAKGVDDLVVALLAHPELRLRVAGDGPRANALAALGERAELLGSLAPARMNDFYDSVSVVAVPSRTTATWSEQFGRVIVEAQARATPVVAYDSGEIPWVASLSAAVLVGEGDVVALGETLSALAGDPAAARTLGLRGRDAVAAHFVDDVLARGVGDLVASSLTAS